MTLQRDARGISTHVLSVTGSFQGANEIKSYIFQRIMALEQL